jgi:hypothetical protein
LAENAGDLRSQLEAVLAENSNLKTNLRQAQIRELIGQQDFSHVREADLEGVPDDQLKVKAEQVQSQRVDDQRQLLKKAGLSDDQVSKVLAGETITLGNQLSPEQQRAATQVTAAQTSPGLGIAPKVDESAVHGRQAIKAYFDQQREAGSTQSQG